MFLKCKKEEYQKPLPKPNSVPKAKKNKQILRINVLQVTIVEQENG